MYAGWSPRRPSAAVWSVVGWAGGALASLLVALGLVVGTAAPAAAHVTLVGSAPAGGSAVVAPLASVRLEFDDVISASFARVQVLGPGGDDVVSGRPRVDGRVVTAPLGADLALGGYRVTFQVVSEDGHRVSGTVAFTLRAAPGTTPGSATAPSPADTSTTTSSSSPPPAARPTTVPAGDRWSSGRLIWVGTGVLLLAVLGAVVLVLDRRRR